jgi:putative MATE family efflux protein
MVRVKLFILIVFALVDYGSSFTWGYSVKKLRLPHVKNVHMDATFSRPTSKLVKTEKTPLARSTSELKNKLDLDFSKVSLPAFLSLAADPVAAIVDAMYVARLGAVSQAAMGIAISAQFSVAKLYNDPLLKTSTSLVAGKEGEDLEQAVASAVATAVVIGFAQSFVFLTLGKYILRVMGVSAQSEILVPALAYLKWRSVGIPAGTVLLVANGIFRGRGDTRTPLYCTLFGSALNILLDPLLIFTCNMGCAGAGAATAIAQWCSVVPMMYLLNRTVPLKMFNRKKTFYTDALSSYFSAGGLLFLRTASKIATYSVASAAAARLGTVPMAAYSLTFSLGFATSQLCEAIAIASQVLIARYFPFGDHAEGLEAARHIVRRSLSLGLLVSGGLSALTYFNQDFILRLLTRSPEVYAVAAAVMPVVLVTQLFKGLEYSTGGIVLGGQDWKWSSFGSILAAVLSVGFFSVMPSSLWNIWVGLAVLMVTQVGVAMFRITSGHGPWAGLHVFKEPALKPKLD